MKHFIPILVLLFFFGSTVRGQYYETGQDPASLKWLQIKTGKYNLIFPESYQSEAIKFAQSLDNSYSRLSSLYPPTKVRVPVIIHNYTSFSNGYVVWAPRRMEIYPTPEQNGIPMDPIEQLTTHELTHVLQMVSLNKGVTKVLSYLGGEQIIGASAIFLPGWFMEGDAVFAETLLSPSGRGRTAAFQKQMKAITLENTKLYSYDKMIAGSFKKYIPDSYQTGYQMIALSYARYGNQLWNKTLDITAKKPFVLNPVNFSLLRNAGTSKEKLYHETFDTLRILWKKEESISRPVSYNPLNPTKKNDFINYYSPVAAGNNSIYAIKTSFSRPPEFVEINPVEKSEKRVHIPGSMYPYSLSGAGEKLVWVESQPDPRWENRTYSVVKIMDLKSKKVTQFSFKTRYMAASLSSDGRFIATVENTVTNQNSLLILDAFTGEVLTKNPIPGNAYPQRPQWSQTDSEISLIFLSDQGEGIMTFTQSDGTWKELIKPGRDDLQASYLRNDSLFFVSSSSGVDNIYLLTPDNKMSKLTNSRFGAYDVYPEAGKIIFSDYTASGYNISETELKVSGKYEKNVTPDPSFLINRFDTLKTPENLNPVTAYNPEPYRKWKHLFRFHSWMPFYADIQQVQSDPTSIRPGFTILSQNQLSTLITSIGYEYTAEKTHVLHTAITWKGWLPVFETRLDYGGNAIIDKSNNSVSDPSIIKPGFVSSNTLSLPLVFSFSRFTQYFRPSLAADFENNYIYLTERNTYDYGQTKVTERLLFQNYHRSSIRDIYPRWAQVIDVFNTSAPFDSEIYGSITTLKTAFYFPGLFANHSLKLRWETETQKPHNNLPDYYNRASMPRGYKNIIPVSLNFLSADYALPLIYPDLNIPGLLFIQRIRTSGFYDYTKGSKILYLDKREFHDYSETFRSFGAELWADFYVLRIPFMLSAGVQTTFRSLNSAPAFELLFNIDIFGTRMGRSRL